MADTRDQILAAARGLFMEQGFDKTSLREVAERVGVTKAALYYYFPSKEELLLALLDPLTQMSGGFLELLQDDEPRVWADALEVFIEFMLQHRELFELIEHNESAVIALSSEETSFSVTHQRFHETIDRALANRDVPLERRVRLMCALGVAISLAHFGRPFEPEADLEEMRLTMVNAMRTILGLRPRRPRVVHAQVG